MKSIKVLINSIDKVKSFCDLTSKQDYELSLQSGRYYINAKSIMGIFSLDLSKPIDLNIHAEGGNTDEIMEVIKPYLV